MNNAMAFVLTIAILVGSAAYSVKNRYTVIQDAKLGTLLIDNWDVANRKIIEKKSSGSWYAVDIIKGGPEVMEFEEKMKKQDYEDFAPAI